MFNRGMRTTSYEEIVSGALDNPEARFDTAITLAHQSLRSLQAEGLVVGGVIFGSAVTRDLFFEPEMDPLSDLDVIVVVKDESRNESLAELRSAARKTLGTTAVSLEVSWMTSSQAASGRHNLSEPMRRWLLRQADMYPELIVGDSPGHLINVDDNNPVATMEKWFQTVVNRMQKVYVDSVPQLTDALSVPKIASRKSLDVLRIIDAADTIQFPPPTSPHLTQEEIARTTKTVYGKRDSDIGMLYHDLAQAKDTYVSYLMHDVRLRLVQKHEFDRYIGHLADTCAPKALELLQRMWSAFENLSDDAISTTNYGHGLDRREGYLYISPYWNH